MGTEPGQARRSLSTFDTTRWSQVLAAGRSGTPESARALSVLCRIYWPPLYGYVRRRVDDPEEARDLTQEFFTRLLEKNVVADADAGRGRFRAFLLTALRNFLANEWDKARAAKRGGGRRPLSFDFEAKERARAPEPADGATPERLYERQWAVSVLERTVDRLREEYRARGREERFERLHAFLTDGPAADQQRELAAVLGTSVVSVQRAVRRMRSDYRRLLRDEVAQTVLDPADVDAELRDLFEALRPVATEGR